MSDKYLLLRVYGYATWGLKIDYSLVYHFSFRLGHFIPWTSDTEVKNWVVWIALNLMAITYSNASNK